MSGRATYFWVIGGEFADTDFSHMAAGKTLEKLGPFSRFKEAYEVWSKYSWARVDDCHQRYVIIEDGAEAPEGGPASLMRRAIHLPGAAFSSPDAGDGSALSAAVQG